MGARIRRFPLKGIGALAGCLLVGCLLMAEGLLAKESCTLEQRAQLERQGVSQDAINSLCGFLSPQNAERLRLLPKPKTVWREPPPECRPFLEGALMARGTDQEALALACSAYTKPPPQPTDDDRSHLLFLPLIPDVYTVEEQALLALPEARDEATVLRLRVPEEESYLFQIRISAMAPILGVWVDGQEQSQSEPSYELVVSQRLPVTPQESEVIVRVRTVLAEETQVFRVFLETETALRFRGKQNDLKGLVGAEGLYDSNPFLRADSEGPPGGKRLRQFLDVEWTRHQSIEERVATRLHLTGTRYDRPELQELDQTHLRLELEWQHGVRDRSEWALQGGVDTWASLPDENLAGLVTREHRPYVGFLWRDHSLLGRLSLEVAEERPQGGIEPGEKGRVERVSVRAAQRDGDRRGSVLIQARRLNLEDPTLDRLETRTWFRVGWLWPQVEVFGRVGLQLDQYRAPATEGEPMATTQSWEVGTGFWPAGLLRWEFRYSAEKQFTTRRLLYGRQQFAVGAFYPF